MTKIDREYSTQQIDEMKWLKQQGFNYTFVFEDHNNFRENS